MSEHPMVEETREIIAELLEDGSDPEAAYLIEHHFAARSEEALEALAVVALKSDYETSEVEEAEDDEGNQLFVMDVVTESDLDEEVLLEQVAQMIEWEEAFDVFYDGWGTYFEDGEEDE